MRFSHELVARFLVGLCALHLYVSAQAAPPSPRDLKNFRFLSLTVRGRAPTADEARQFARGEKTRAEALASWLEDPEHKARMKLFFRDIMGVDNLGTIFSSVAALTNDAGFFVPRRKTDLCTINETVLADAWWSTEKVRICTSLTQPAQRTIGGRLTNCLSRLLTDPLCGCGPNLGGCMPQTLRSALTGAIEREFDTHALDAYERNGTWKDFFGTTHLYADRLLYFKYLESQQLRNGTPLTAAQLTKLQSLQDGVYERMAYPNAANVERGGVATYPGFMRKFMNYRSRIQMLSRSMLCDDVGSWLNTGNLTRFYNTSLPDEDLAHSSKADCKGCHLPMDNMGSTLLNWSGGGAYQPAILGVGGVKLSEIGKAFGQDLNGPKSMIDAIIDHGPGFDVCMARTAWQQFTTLPWEALKPEVQTAFVQAADRGPRDLFHTVLSSDVLWSRELGDPQRPPTPDYVTAVKPIVDEHCGGSDCHSNGTTLGPGREFLRDEAAFSRVPAGMISSERMPPPDRPRLTPDQIRIIILFLTR